MTIDITSLNTSAISDALDSLNLEGYLPEIRLISSLSKPVMAPIFTVQYQPYANKPETFMPAGDYIDAVPSGAVIAIDNQGNTQCSTWGGILTEVAQLKSIAGVIIDGACRDQASLITQTLPIYAKGVTACSGKNRVYMHATQAPIQLAGMTVCPGDWMFADRGGVCIIAKKNKSEVISRAGKIIQTEKNIIDAVKKGMSLSDARKQYNYHQPWLVTQ